MAKITLDIQYDYNFVLFAISCHEPDYKLCFAVNRAIGIDFIREAPIELKNKKQEDQLLFSLFAFVDEEEMIEYNLVANRSYNASRVLQPNKTSQPDLFGDHEPEATSQKAYLIPELNQADYLLIIRAEYEPGFVMKIESKLKQIPFILNTTIVDPNDLPTKKNLIF